MRRALLASVVSFVAARMALPDTNVMGYSATQYEAIKHTERFTTDQLAALGMSSLDLARMTAIAAAAVATERAARRVREERARADAIAAAAAASTALAAVRPAPLSATAAAWPPRLSKSQKNRLRREKARASHRAVNVAPAAPNPVVVVFVPWANCGGY